MLLVSLFVCTAIIETLKWNISVDISAETCRNSWYVKYTMFHLTKLRENTCTLCMKDCMYGCLWQDSKLIFSDITSFSAPLLNLGDVDTPAKIRSPMYAKVCDRTPTSKNPLTIVFVVSTVISLKCGPLWSGPMFYLHGRVHLWLFITEYWSNFFRDNACFLKVA